MKTFSTNTNISFKHICKIISKNYDENDIPVYLTSNLKENGDIPLSPNFIPLQSDKVSFNNHNNEDLVFNIGDIILINESGQGTRIFDKYSKSNALYLTDRCNCTCIMCPQPPKTDDCCDYIGLALETVSLLDSDIEVIGITGGEPTMVWDGLLKVLHACRHKLPEASIELLTNAKILKDYHKANELYNAGGKNMIACVPLYADTSVLHDEMVNSKGSFWETIEGVYNLERLGIRVEVRNVVTCLNYMRLSKWCEFIYRNLPFVSHVALMGVEPIGLAFRNLKEIWIDPSEYMPILEKSIKVLNQRDVNVSIYNHQLCTLPKWLWRFSRKAISEWKNVFFEECNICLALSNCGGFFKSSKNIRSKGIKAITEKSISLL